MRKTIAGAVAVLVVLGTSELGANLRGSEVMRDVVNFMIAGFCPGTSGLVFTGGGDDAGEQAMTGTGPITDRGAQSVAPMARPLGIAVCSSTQASPSTAAGIFVCLEGIAIIASSAAAVNCSLKFAVGADWRDVLRLLYAGAHPSPDNTGAGSVANCGSVARRDLANNWNSLFNAPCAGSIACTQVQHAFRSADLSGSTDTFLALLGLPRISNNPFCNGAGLARNALADPNNSSDFDDADPIRRPCVGRGDLANSEQICGNVAAAGPLQNTLGLVQVVLVPETHAGLSPDLVYATQPCSPGTFEWRDHPSAVPLCPYGFPPQVGACLLPFWNGPSGPNFNCLNRQTNRGFFLEASGGDGRIYNLAVRRPDGAIQRDVRGRRLVGSFYRIHTTRVLAGGVGSGCQNRSSTIQLGCLAAASPCSVVLGGREGLNHPGTMALRVRGRMPSPGPIQAVVTDPPSAYPLARKLYLNSIANPDIVGIGTAGSVEFRLAQRALKACMANPEKAKIACENVGLVEAPFGPQCEDYNETTMCGAASNANACP